MFTTFHLLHLLGLIGGLGLGIALGANLYGVLGGILGGIAGFAIGNFIGRLPLIAILMSSIRRFDLQSNEELLRSLHTNDCGPTNLILLELKYRGVDISKELPRIFEMLVSSDSGKRVRGWAALTSAFPDLAHQLPDYNPTASRELCKEQIQQHLEAS